MNIGIGMLFFISHVLGEFYICDQKKVFCNQNDFCNQKVAKKNTKYKNIIIHSIIYQIILLLMLLIIGFNTKYMMTIIVIGISHYVVDSILFLIQTNKFIRNPWIKNNLFFIDQLIHIFIIILGLWYLKSETTSSHITFNIFENDYYYIRLVFAFLLIGKPSNVLFKKIFIKFKPDSLAKIDNEIPSEDKTYNNAGATIGTLERILILICIINGLYSSIGLILTAKSIARYNRISNEPEFSEYYLLGTLSSVLFAIITYLICFNLV